MCVRVIRLSNEGCLVCCRLHLTEIRLKCCELSRESLCVCVWRRVKGNVYREIVVAECRSLKLLVMLVLLHMLCCSLGRHTFFVRLFG